MSEASFLEQLDQAFQDFRQPLPTQACALVCLLVDHWRDLREEYGYAGVFELRKQLRSTVSRNFELVPDILVLNEAGLVALVRGDSVDQLSEQAQTLFDSLSGKSFELSGDQVAMTVSLGFCPFDLRFTGGSRMLTETVRRVEELRDQGGNAWLRISPDISAAQATADDRRMLGLLMQSLRNNSVRPVFQALLATDGSDIHSFQMLPRLQAADGELIAAADFLAVARSSNLLATLDRWMLSKAMQLLRGRYRHESIRLFVSQADELLVDEKRSDNFFRQVDEDLVLGNRLVIDFHLGDAMTHLKGAERFFPQARERGLGICLSLVDDHSNWMLLEQRLRCDYLRMAPEFVRRLARSEGLVRKLDDLTRGVREQGVKIIMPMIEDAGAAAHLWSSSVDFLQGNLIQPVQEQIQIGD